MNTKKLAASIVCGAMLLTATPAFAADEVTSDFAEIYINIDLDGKVPNTQGVLYGGQAWVPLRVVADGLGMQITWDAKTPTSTIYNGTRGMDFSEGENLYTSYCTVPGMVGMPAPKELAGSPAIGQDGRMWVPAEAFEVLVGYEVAVQDDTVVISKMPEPEIEENIAETQVEE